MGLNGLKNMSGIIGESLFHQLAMIEAKGKDANSPFQNIDAVGKTA